MWADTDVIIIRVSFFLIGCHFKHNSVEFINIYWKLDGSLSPSNTLNCSPCIFHWNLLSEKCTVRNIRFILNKIRKHRGWNLSECRCKKELEPQFCVSCMIYASLVRYVIFLLSLLHSDRPKFVYIFGLSECKSRDPSDHFRLDMWFNKNVIQQEWYSTRMRFNKKSVLGAWLCMDSFWMYNICQY